MKDPGGGAWAAEGEEEEDGGAAELAGVSSPKGGASAGGWRGLPGSSLAPAPIRTVPGPLWEEPLRAGFGARGSSAAR